MVLDITAFMMTGGYAGVLIANMLASATIIFPVPGLLVTLAFVNTLNPWLLGLVSATGATIGELTGYAVGRGGRRVIRAKHEKLLSNAEKWTEKHGPFPIIILFSATPLPTDIIGILSGVISYDIRKFLLAVFIGKMIKYLVIIFSFIYGVEFMYGLSSA